MKHRVLVLGLAAVAALGQTSCKDDPAAETPMITIDGATGSELTAKQLTARAQEFTIGVLATGEYTVEIPSAAQLWLEHVKPATRALTSSEVKFSVKAHTGLDPREAIITLKCGDFSQKYKIVQSPTSEAITVEIADVKFKDIATQDQNGVWTIGKLGDDANSISNRGAVIPLSVGPNSAFTVRVDESTPWLTIDSSAGSRDVNINVGTTYNTPSDPSDYSRKRIGVVHFESLDKKSSTKMIFVQAPRVAGQYVLETPKDGDPKPTDAATSQLGKQLLAEVEGYRVGITTIKITGPMTEFDWQALAFFEGTWLTDADKLNNLAPVNMSVLDLSEAVFETVPENVFKRASNNTNTVIREIILPEGVKTISQTAFQYLTGLEKVNIPSTVEYIGDNAFINNPATGMLREPVVLPRSLKYLGASAFEGNKFSKISFEEPTAQFCKDGATRLAIGDRAFCASSLIISASSRGGSMQDDLVIPEWVGSIGVQSFAGLYYQTPESPLAVGTGNTILQTGKTGATIKIGGNVESIGYGAFAFNLGVTKFDFGTGKDITVAQYNNSNLGYGLFARSGIAEFEWPVKGRNIKVKNAPSAKPAEWTDEAEGVVSLPNSIFAGCVELRKVTIGYGVTHIGRAAFFGSNISSTAPVGYGNGRVALDELTLPTSHTELGTDAFNSCRGIGLVHIVDRNGAVTRGTTPGLWDLRKTKLAKVGTQAFYNFARASMVDGQNPAGQTMTGIRFPSTINNFQNYAFYFCEGLTGSTIYLPDGFARGTNGVPTAVTSGPYVVNNVNAFQTAGNATSYPTFKYETVANWDNIAY